MKLGNTSQTQVPVPNFYMTKNVIENDLEPAGNEIQSTKFS